MANDLDVKIQLTGVPRQMVQTKDNVSVDVDSVICWHVISPYRAAFGINDVRTALVERAREFYFLTSHVRS
jgi:erythrocyte band 7 integral membrane protein